MSLDKAFARFVAERNIPSYTANKIAEWVRLNAKTVFATADKRSESLAGYMRGHRIPQNQINDTAVWLRDVGTRGVDAAGNLGAERPVVREEVSRVPTSPPPKTEHQRWAADQTAALRQGGAAAEAYWASARDPALDAELRGAWQQAATDTAAQAPAPAAPATPQGGGADGA